MRDCLPACGVELTSLQSHRSLVASANPDFRRVWFASAASVGVSGLISYLVAEQIDAVIDATHPFAANISRNAAGGVCPDRSSAARVRASALDETARGALARSS